MGAYQISKWMVGRLLSFWDGGVMTHDPRKSSYEMCTVLTSIVLQVAGSRGLRLMASACSAPPWRLQGQGVQVIHRGIAVAARSRRKHEAGRRKKHRGTTGWRVPHSKNMEGDGRNDMVVASDMSDSSWILNFVCWYYMLLLKFVGSIPWWMCV